MKQNKKAVVIGITGPAGCGKSYVCKRVAELTDTLIIDTDTLAKEQMKKGGISYAGVVKEFGKEILLENGEIDRKKLASIVFGDEERLKVLNSLTHPNVIKESKRIIKENRDKVNVILLESALLVDAGCDKMCDLVWYIHTPLKERRERLKVTRGYSDEKIDSVIKSQRRTAFYREHADTVIQNSALLGEEKLKKALKRRLKVVANFN